jgi:hypothetical protein
MGDEVPGPGVIEGRQFQVAVMPPEKAIAWAHRLGSQFQEETWFAARLSEAASGWGTLVEQRLVVVVREVLDVSTLDEAVSDAAQRIPDWLTPFVNGK